MKLSIVIPSADPGKVLDNTLQHIKHYKDTEIIVVIDKNPTLLSESIINYYKSSKNFNIKVIYNKKNMGASYSRNIGIKEAKGKYIMLLDDDIALKRGIINEMIKKLGKYDCITGNLDMGRIDNSWAARYEEYSYKYSGFSIIKNLLHNKSYSDIISPKYNVSTACCLFKRKVFDKIKFPENLKITGEDVKFIDKFKKNGFKGKKLNKIIGTHYFGGSFGGYLSKRIRQGETSIRRSKLSYILSLLPFALILGPFINFNLWAYVFGFLWLEPFLHASFITDEKDLSKCLLWSITRIMFTRVVDDFCYAIGCTKGVLSG